MSPTSSFVSASSASSLVARVSLRLARIISKPDAEEQDAARDLEGRQRDAEEAEDEAPGDAEDVRTTKHVADARSAVRAWAWRG